MSDQTTAMVSGGLLATDPEHGDWRQVFRYSKNGRTGLSGYPLILNTRAVFENACNRNYDDYQDGYIKEYDFPRSYEKCPWVRENVNKFIVDKMGTMFKYHLLQDGRVYSCHNVKLIGYDLSRKVMLFRW